MNPKEMKIRCKLAEATREYGYKWFGMKTMLDATDLIAHADRTFYELQPNNQESELCSDASNIEIQDALKIMRQGGFIGVEYQHGEEHTEKCPDCGEPLKFDGIAHENAYTITELSCNDCGLKVDIFQDFEGEDEEEDDA